MSKVAFRTNEGNTPIQWGVAIITHDDGSVSEEPISAALCAILMREHAALQEIAADRSYRSAFPGDGLGSVQSIAREALGVA